MIGFCDRHIEKERPWEEGKNQKQVISDLLFALKNIAEMLHAFLPETSERILEQIKGDSSQVKRGKPLFPRI
ncbi:hypothetical protein KAS79_03965 [Candidatus Parcubacteria bacterium]|nr:hypothetical protein [Candidatus Parcubacteria bacterium]